MNWPPLRELKADVSSVSPSSERFEKLWVVCGLYTKRWSYASVQDIGEFEIKGGDVQLYER